MKTAKTKEPPQRNMISRIVTGGILALSLGLSACGPITEPSDSEKPEKKPAWTNTDTKRIESLGASPTSNMMNYSYTYKTKDEGLKQSTIKEYWDDSPTTHLDEFDSKAVTVYEDANTENSRIEFYECKYPNEDKKDEVIPFLSGPSKGDCPMPSNRNQEEQVRLDIHVPEGTLKDLNNKSDSEKGETNEPKPTENPTNKAE